MRRLLPVLVVAALAIPACAAREDLPRATVPYFAGHTATFPDGVARTLAQVPLPRLRGADGPAAVNLADGRIVYETFDEKVAVDPQRTAEEQGIRDDTVLGRQSVRSFGKGGDRLLVDGAFAPAVSATGRVAVGLLDDPDQRFGDHYDAAIAVLEPGATKPVRWTASGRLRTPVAWLGDTLLYAVPAEVGLPSLWLATGPGAGRQLVAAGAFVAAAAGRVLIAVPDRDGRRALEVRSTADGRLIARQETELRWVGFGSWTAQGIVAVGAPEPGVMTALDLGEDLQLRKKVDIRVPAELAAPPNEVAVARDHKSFGVATFVAETPELSWVLLDCSLAGRECRRADLSQGTEYAGFVSNPST
jgi:hypothetical protein